MRPWHFLATLFLALTVAAQQPAPAKRVEIDKTVQLLRAYEDDQLVFQTNVSTGKWEKQFFAWVEVGTPTEIFGRWEGR